MSSYLIYKPFGMLSQFTKEEPYHVTLADLEYKFEKDVYPVGRLDKDSEGLLFLTNDKSWNQRLLNPKKEQEKEYWAQVEGEPTVEDLQPFAKGIDIKVGKSRYITLPAQAEPMPDPSIAERNPPIRQRKNQPTSWIKIIITEGKNRQVRKMCAAVGFPVLRLLRVRVGQFNLWDKENEMLMSGEVIRVEI